MAIQSLSEIRPAASAGTIEVWLPAVLVALIPAAFALVNPTWLFSPLGYLDPWIFVGFGFDYDLSSFLATDYKAARLPWVLYEFWVHRLLPPLPAQYVLHILTHMVTGVAVYAALRRLLGTLPGFLGGTFVVVYTEFYSATGGADYMNSGAAALYALTFLTVTIAAEQERPASLAALAGALFGLTVLTDLMFVNLAVTLAAHAVVLRRKAKLPLDIRRILLWSFAGLIVVTALLGLANRHYGRPLLFFWMEITRVFAHLEDRSLDGTSFTPWATGWYLQASYLGALLAAAVICLLAAGAMWLRRRKGLDAVALSLLLQFVFLFLYWVPWQLIGHHALEPDYFTYALLVPMGMAIAALFSGLPFSFESKAVRWSVVLGMLAALLMPLLDQPLVLPLLRLYAAPYPLLRGFVWMGAGLGALLALRRLPKLALLPVAGALFVGIANVGESASLGLFLPTVCNLSRDGYLTLFDINQWLRTVDPRLQHVYVWIDETEKLNAANCDAMPIGYLGHSLASMGFHYMAGPFPVPPVAKIDAARLKEVAADDPLILVVSQRPENATALTRRFEEIGVTLTSEIRHFQEGGLSLDVPVLRRAKP